MLKTVALCCSLLLLATCESPSTSDVASSEDDTFDYCYSTIPFYDGTGDGNGVLCDQAVEGAYANQDVTVYHYRGYWMNITDLNLESVCEGVLCNVEPSTTCQSPPQFWDTSDGWYYAWCRTEDDIDGRRARLWRRYGEGNQYDEMLSLSLEFCPNE